MKVKLFSSAWCSGCKVLYKTLEGKDYEKVDIEENIEEAAKLNIRNLPTTIFYKDSEVVERIVGLFSAEKFDEVVEKWK